MVRASGSGISALLGRHTLAAFFLLAFAISWAVVAGVVLLGLKVDALVMAAITAGPALSALFVTAAIEGGTGVVELLRKLLLWRVPAGWYLFALFGIPAISTWEPWFSPARGPPSIP
jgi:hypothetical protein